jgi:putative transposase
MGVLTCRRDLPGRTLIWNQQHLFHALREFEHFYNGHRPHQGIANARPLRALPPPDRQNLPCRTRMAVLSRRRDSAHGAGPRA